MGMADRQTAEQISRNLGPVQPPLGWWVGGPGMSDTSLMYYQLHETLALFSGLACESVLFFLIDDL